MKRSLAIFCSIVCFLSAGSLSSSPLKKRVGEIKYVSQQSFYINLGTAQGLSAGDTLMVKRNNRAIAKLVVANISRLSASCKWLSGSKNIKQGDRVELFVRVATPEPEEVIQKSQPSRWDRNGASTTQKKSSTSSRRRRSSINRVKGRMSLQSLWLADRSGSGLGYSQLGLRSKLRVQRVLGTPFELRLRWRSRAYNRNRTASSLSAANEWTHNVYEVGLVYENRESPFEFGFGRILAREIRGLGYIDGGTFSMRVRGPWRLGVAGGTQPNQQNSGFQTSIQKFGLFLNFEKGDYQTKRVSSTVAFSGAYHGGETSREFLYFQNNFTAGSTFSLYQTVEMDINRGWKTNHGEDTIRLTNFFLSGRYSPKNFVSFNLSYDARKPIRIYETRSIPDSLFDETTRKGMHAGVNLRLPYRMRLSGNFGVRFRSGQRDNVISASSALSVRQIFNTWASVNARFSYFSTMFSKGYRPNVSVRLPLTRGLSVTLSGGSYIYDTGGKTTSNNWVEAEGYYRINRRLFASFGYRTFVNSNFDSGRLFLETGIVF